MSNDVSVELEGTTFSVYLYVVKEGKPVGPRDVMRGAHLSSPSVAYRHLQKLEDAGLLKKNEYGEYLLKKKMKVNGYHWIGRRLLPNAMFYFYFFFGLFIYEIVVLAIHFAVETYEFKAFFAGLGDGRKLFHRDRDLLRIAAVLEGCLVEDSAADLHLLR